MVSGLGHVCKIKAFDWDYFNECINKITRDKRIIESALKNQTLVTTNIDEQTPNT